MQNDKIKLIENKKDAIIFLNQLIQLVDKRMKRLKRAINDLEKELSNYNEDTKQVYTEVYHKHQERIECLSSYLLNLFGDETKTAVSYKQFRNTVEKRVKKGQLDFQLDELESDIITLLNDFRDMRNWTHHVPQSILNSQVNYMKEVTGYPADFVEFNFSQSQIYVLDWEYHDIMWIKELYENSNSYYAMFSKVFQRMKKDYSKLIGKSMRIIREQQKDARPHGYKLIAEESFSINMGKKKSKSFSRE